MKKFIPRFFFKMGKESFKKKRPIRKRTEKKLKCPRKAKANKPLELDYEKVAIWRSKIHNKINADGMKNNEISMRTEEVISVKNTGRMFEETSIKSKATYISNEDINSRHKETRVISKETRAVNKEVRVKNKEKSIKNKGGGDRNIEKSVKCGEAYVNLKEAGMKNKASERNKEAGKSIDIKVTDLSNEEAIHNKEASMNRKETYISNKEARINDEETGISNKQDKINNKETIPTRIDKREEYEQGEWMLVFLNLFV